MDMMTMVQRLTAVYGIWRSPMQMRSGQTAWEI